MSLPACALLVLGALWFFRRVLLAPWASYKSHTQSGIHVFLTVKRVRWYPPFLAYEETWRSLRFDRWGERLWFRETDGLRGRDAALTALFECASARAEEVSELLK